MKFDIKILLTRNVLITYDDGSIDLNHYGDVAQLIGNAVTMEQPILYARFESGQFDLETVNREMFDTFEAKITKWCEENMTKEGKPPNQHPPLIKLQ